MSQIYENTIVYLNEASGEIRALIEKCASIVNFEEIQSDDFNTIAVFDSFGDVDDIDDCKELKNLCLLKESADPDHGSISTFVKGGHSISPLRIANLIESGFLFKKLDREKRKSLLEAIRYFMEDEPCLN